MLGSNEYTALGVCGCFRVSEMMRFPKEYVLGFFLMSFAFRDFLLIHRYQELILLERKDPKLSSCSMALGSQALRQKTNRHSKIVRSAHTGNLRSTLATQVQG